MTQEEFEALKLSRRDLETLEELKAAIKNHERYDLGSWVRPLDIGGRNGSHHSATLLKLYRKGLVDRRRRGGTLRPPYRYSLTLRGLRALQLNRRAPVSSGPAFEGANGAPDAPDGAEDQQR